MSLPTLRDPPPPEAIAKLLLNVHFEVFLRAGVEDQLERGLPRGSTVHVRCTPEEGGDHSVAVAPCIAARGFRVLPHISARTVRSRRHPCELIDRVGDAGMTGAFFPGGDSPEPRGSYASAVELLDDLGALDHCLRDVGVAAYPEGPPTISDEALEGALLDKQAVATFMSSQSCFDPRRIIAWLRTARAQGVMPPLLVGVPGEVPLRRLVAALRRYGAVLSGRFSPSGVLAGVAPHVEDLGLRDFTSSPSRRLPQPNAGGRLAGCAGRTYDVSPPQDPVGPQPSHEPDA